MNEQVKELEKEVDKLEYYCQANNIKPVVMFGDKWGIAEPLC